MILIRINLEDNEFTLKLEHYIRKELMDKVFPEIYDQWELTNTQGNINLAMSNNVIDTAKIIVDQLLNIKYNNEIETQIDLEVFGSEDLKRHLNSSTVYYLDEMVSKLNIKISSMNSRLLKSEQKYNELVGELFEFNSEHRTRVSH